MRPPIPSVSLSRRARISLWTIAALVVVIVVLVQLTGVYINWLWFGSVGERHVYTTVFWTRFTLFFLFGAVMSAIIGGNLTIAYLLSPPFRPMSPEQQNIERYRALLEPRRIAVLLIAGGIAFLSAGLSAQGNWATWQLWMHGGAFGQTDPLFHKDIGFYAWDYPAYRSMLAFGFTAIIFSFVLALIVHYLSGAIRLQTPGPKITIAARRHLTLLAFVFTVLKALAYWLDRYGLVFSQRSSFTGASYTDVHAVLPARTILFWIALVIAALLLASLWLRSTLLPSIAFVSMLVLSILISGIYPALLQNFSVKPNASTKEAPYIRDNIVATRQAYGLVDASSGGTVEYRSYPGNANASKAALTTTPATIDNIRILDPNVLSPTFTQQQAQQKNFYGFPDKLDVDRYTVGGVTSDYIVGVRELSAVNLNPDQRNWINEHTNYTHGYGFVAAPANTESSGSPIYTDRDIPQTGPLNNAYPLTTPQVYYGELLPDYAIVGGQGAPREFDGSGNAKITYHGSGGISLSSPLTKLAFAVNYTESNFLLNDAVKAAGAKIIINRDPRQIVQKVAPFLKVDSDPYPVVDKATGHLVWMVDGYTTMADYPYAQRESLARLTNDSLTTQQLTAGQPNSQINYIRNSVKATVDAYNGTVHLYDWSQQGANGRPDPVLHAWENVFPGLVQPASAMPAALRAHVRYPEDLFMAQRAMLQQYHVDNPVTFYNGSNRWTVPSDPYDPRAGSQPPYYVLARALDRTTATPEFQLTSPMKVNAKTNLASYVSVDSDPGPNYGRMTILQLPSSSVIAGPQQVANNFNSTDVISYFNTYVGQQGSQLVHGNLLTLPVGGSFLYIEPFYVQGQNGYPLLRRIAAAYGDGNQIGFGATVQGALQDFQTGQTGSTLSNPAGGGNGPSPGPGSSSSSSPSSTPSSGPPAGTGSAVTLQQLAAANAALKQATSSGDIAAINRAAARFITLTQRYLQQHGGAQPSGGPSGGAGSGSASGGSPTPAPSGSPSGSSSP